MPFGSLELAAMYSLFGVIFTDGKGLLVIVKNPRLSCAGCVQDLTVPTSLSPHLIALPLCLMIGYLSE